MSVSQAPNKMREGYINERSGGEMSTMEDSGRKIRWRKKLGWILIDILNGHGSVHILGQYTSDECKRKEGLDGF